jgi:peptidoglycan/LPS O-acetylase OafA/YrhL
MVFFFHSFTSNNKEVLTSNTYRTIKQGFFVNGNLGVNFFFVLSGFLISYFLIIEKNTTSRINILHFWFRRILRIWPLYFFCVIFGFFIFPFLKSYLGQSPEETAHLINYLTFTSNFDFIANGRPDASILGVLWSVSIEEQFYLVWPILLSFIPVKHYWILFSTLILISLGYRIYHNDYYHNEFHTLSCMNDLVIGSFGAWLIIHFKSIEQFFLRSGRLIQIVPYVLFIIYFFSKDELLISNKNFIPIERIFSAFIMLWIICDQAININGIFRLSRFKFLSKSGKYTYGMYCLHFLAILIVITVTKSIFHQDDLITVLLVEPLFSLVLTFFISVLSYRYFEQYFLKAKTKFA